MRFSPATSAGRLLPQRIATCARPLPGRFGAPIDASGGEVAVGAVTEWRRRGIATAISFPRPVRKKCR